MLVGALRGERRTRTVVGFLLAVCATVVTCMAVLSLNDESVAVAGAVITLGTVAVFLGYLLVPVLAAARDPLDPRRFRVFGVDEHRMPLILAAAGLLSVPSLALVAVTVCTAIVAVSHGVPVWAAILLFAIAAASILLAGRIGMGISAALLPERRPREMTTLFVLGVIVIALPVAIFLASQEWGARLPGPVATAALALGFTPFAPALASAFAIARGDVAVATMSAVIAAVTLGALWALWRWHVRAALTSTERPTTVRERAGLGWFAVLPSGPFGAIAARSLIYWLRDRRYLVNIVIVPVAGLLAVLPLLVAGVPGHLVALVPVLVMALFFGWLPHNDVAYDSTAFWIHVASGVGGFADRLGRLVPIIVVAVPVLAIAVPITLAVIDDWALLPGLIGAVASLFLSGLGLSSIVSVSAPYAVSRPGDSPFQQPQRSSGHGAFGHATALIGALLVSLPAIVLLYRGVSDAQATVAAFWTGLATGVGVLCIGLALGALVYARRGERLMEFVETS